MLLKNLLKTVGFLSIISSSFAKEKVSNDCTEIESYVKREKKEIYSVYDKCEVNKEGKVISINLSSSEMNSKIFKKILSYPTIEKIELTEFSFNQEYVDIIGDATNIKELIVSGGDFAKNLKYDSWDHIETLDIEQVSNFKNLNYVNTLKNLKIYLLSEVSNSDIKKIGALTNLESFELIGKDLKDLNLEPLKNVKKLTSLTIRSIFGLGLTEIPDFIFDFKNLEHLNLGENTISKIPDKIKNLKNLKYFSLAINNVSSISKELGNLKIEDLNIEQNKLQSIPDVVYNLKSLKSLDISFNQIKSISEKIGNLKNLEILEGYGNKIESIPDTISNLKKLRVLDLSGNSITKIPKALGELESLEELYLQINKINSELPSSLNNLTKLKKIYLERNEDIKGKTITNESLEVCHYGVGYSICKTKEMKCFDPGDDSEYEDDLKLCDSDENSDDTKISTDYKCGKGKGKCPAGQCCSKYGWCGRSEKHCLIESGCQSEFGECKTSTQDTISTNGKCGEKYGKCPEGKCCSKYGWCGTTSEYCDVSSGCQSEFGKCNTKKVDGKCGKEYGKCPSGQCCSKYGWCGKDSKYCGAGCQHDFGKCN